MINIKAHLFVYTIPACRLDCCAAWLQPLGVLLMCHAALSEIGLGGL